MKKLLLFTTFQLAFRLLFAQTDTLYVAENVPLPPGLTAEVGGLDFLPDGRLAVAFHRGEVMTYQPKTGVWKRFAEGLHDPLGVLAVSNTEILVMQRPELTRVRDTNDDGLADEYTAVSDDYGISGNYHEFAFGPVRDHEGNLFIGLNTASNGAGIRPELRGDYNPLGRKGRMYSCVPYRGWVMKIDKTGKITPFALGFRSPNSLGFDAAGRLLVCDNQGDWLGTSKLYHVQEGQFYGHPTSLVWKKDFPKTDPLTLPVKILDSMRTRESVAFPHGYVANSPTQPVLDATGGKFGPFTGQVFVGEMDHPFLLRVLLEDVDGATQGAAIPLPVRGLRRGNNRLAFAPDGSLWVGQTDHGWVGSEGIQRIRFTGGAVMEVQNVSLTRTGFDLTFTQPLAAADTALFHAKRFYYEYHQAYGSKKFEEAAVPVSAASLSPDGRTVSLELELKPGFIYELTLGSGASRTGTKPLSRLVCYTLNRLRR